MCLHEIFPDENFQVSFITTNIKTHLNCYVRPIIMDLVNVYNIYNIVLEL